MPWDRPHPLVTSEIRLPQRVVCVCVCERKHTCMPALEPGVDCSEYVSFSVYSVNRKKKIIIPDLVLNLKKKEFKISRAAVMVGVSVM